MDLRDTFHITTNTLREQLELEAAHKQGHQKGQEAKLERKPVDEPAPAQAPVEKAAHVEKAESPKRVEAVTKPVENKEPAVKADAGAGRVPDGELEVTKIFKKGREYVGLEVKNIKTGEVKQVKIKTAIDHMVKEKESGTKKRAFTNFRIQIYQGKVIPRPQGDIPVVQA